jgi:hypothetical protein
MAKQSAKKPAPARKPAPAKKPASTKKAASAANADLAEVPPPEGYAPAAAFDDTITRNRACALPSSADVPKPAPGYRPTDPKMRSRRLRKLPFALRAESVLALQQLAARGADLKKELGPYAPDPKHCADTAARLAATSALVTAAQNLLRFAKEVDQIAGSDAYQVLHSTNKLLEPALSHNPDLAQTYAAVGAVFKSIGDAVRTGQAESKAKKTKPA